MFTKTLVCGMGVFLLSGCTTTPKPAPVVPPPSPVLICLPMKTYSDAQQKQAVQEIQEYGKFAPQLVNMLEDYGVMREEDRECLAGPPVPSPTTPSKQ